MSAQVEKIIQLGAKLTAIFDKYFIKIYFFPTPSVFNSVRGFCIGFRLGHSIFFVQ